MEEKYLTYGQVAKLAGVSESKVRSDRKAGKIFCEEKELPKVRFLMEEAKGYAEWVASKGNLTMDFDLTQPYKMLPTGVRTHKFFSNPDKYRGGINIAVNRNGDFVNLNRMQRIKPYKTGNGHLQVKLWNGFQLCTHDLINFLWNDNALCKPHTHHINGVKTDNRAVNLISLTVEEHKHAHKLMNAIKAATTKEERTAAKKTYSVFIKEMRKANKETQKEDLRIIWHLDYSSDDSHHYYMFVTEKSWQKYLQTKNDMDLEIRGECFCYISNKRKDD